MKTPRTIAEIRADHRVTDFFDEGPDGDSNNNWWLYLKDGYICEFMGSGTIHESTVKDCAELLKDVRLKTKEEWIHDHGIDSWNAHAKREEQS